MQRREEEDDDEYFPPGFRWQRKSRRSSENHASSNTSNEISRDKGKRKCTSGEVNESPIMKNKTTTVEIHPSPISELDEETKNQSAVHANFNGFTESSDKLSFQGENGQVYTLSDPPKSLDLNQLTLPQIDAPSVVSVKQGLVSFLLEASPNDVSDMIIQANNIFAFLQCMKVDYMLFYNEIRAYIGRCLERYAMDKELLIKSKKIEEDVNAAEENIEKAKSYMAPLEARVEDMKELLEKLEVELEERKRDLRNLEAAKAKKVEELATLTVELKANASDAEKSKQLITDNTSLY